MKSLPQSIVAIAVCAAAWSSAAAQSPATDPSGVQVPVEQTQRAIHIDSHTRWVNVKQMEAIRFVVGQGNDARSFGWRFDGAPQLPFKLSRIPPAAALIGAQDITVYMDRSDLIDAY
ncbi:CzcE family metal-binding protein [Roseateles saccharophilus]|jgi:hypothetical protein|uniref:Heavy-metal resistance protein CzcE n=1 Tax=Roseateles saccharophilus TaxID=304 RepID=A0A4R3VKQ0_ROSSA|nr:CzcE family metal-binding protein [Roseateles saccharophilus]MDG0831306.1 CzcE family metal-binding protein [Roseateles saccharophilus]TCV04434.1 heavy-metal resistance protein CzcE [Roseateles saccharophilus]